MLKDQLGQMAVFRFPSSSYDPETGIATFDYLLDGPGGSIALTETVRFPLPAEPPTPARRAAFDRVLELLHLVAGVSYYKVAAPRRIEAPRELADEVVAYVDAIYTKGMAEYAYRNDLPHVLSVGLSLPFPDHGLPEDIRRDQGRVAALEELSLSDASRRPLSAVGGGKDSIVTLETLRAAGFDPVPFSVNPNPHIEAVNDASGLPALAARRTLDPRLFELNAAGARNGHIPVTAVNSLIAVATTVLHGLGPVVMSNERSASDPNLIWNGHEINHQWSKGIEAEGLLRSALTAHAGLAEPYFSLLRTLSELHIAKMFAGFTGYDDVVTSCNAAYKLRGASDRWCGHCPKCRFVFLAMAPFMPPSRLIAIFGHDLLSDESQVPGYLQILGIDGHKPWECVGEVEESLVALAMLAKQPAWRDTPVVRALVEAVPPQAWAAASESEVFTPGGPNFVPEPYAKALAAVTG